MCANGNIDQEEIEVTPEMIEAGVTALSRHYGELGEPKEFAQDAVRDVFVAMHEARGRDTASSLR